MTADPSAGQDATVAFVAEALGLDPDQAERAVRATLETLAERIDAGEARDLAASVSPALAASLHTTTPAEGFDADEFVRRVAQREGVEAHVAERHIPIVLEALQRTVGDQEYRDVVAELPAKYARLLPTGPAVDVRPAEAFFARIAEQAGVDGAQAQRIADAALELLAERIDGGEVDDLIFHLPLELHEPLRRGREHGGGKATKMKLDDFVERFAERAATDPLTAREHLHAVFAALREALGDEEFFDVLSELPPDYQATLVR
jgi:uncharacterized protein (DUF2267 family)